MLKKDFEKDIEGFKEDAKREFILFLLEYKMKYLLYINIFSKVFIVFLFCKLQ